MNPPAAKPSSPPGPKSTGRLARILGEELGAIQPLFLLATALVSLLPRGSCPRLRCAIYRACGLRIGPGTRIFGPIELSGHGAVRARFSVGDGCTLQSPLWIDLSAGMRVGNRVVIGPHAIFITAGHDLGDPNRRGGFVVPAPIVIEDDVRLGASVTVLPGITIGRGSVVAAGSLVAADVPADARVGGVPARAIRALPEPGPSVV